MKKFKSSLLKLGNAEVLTKEEMKNVRGGVMPPPPPPGGYCASGQQLYQCGVSTDCGLFGGVTCGVDAMDAVNKNKAYWRAAGCNVGSVACNSNPVS